MQQTEQWKRSTNRIYLKRRQLAGEKKSVSDQISKTVYQFYKLNWLRQNVKDQTVEKQ